MNSISCEHVSSVTRDGVGIEVARILLQGNTVETIMLRTIGLPWRSTFQQNMENLCTLIDNFLLSIVSPHQIVDTFPERNIQRALCHVARQIDKAAKKNLVLNTDRALKSCIFYSVASF